MRVVHTSDWHLGQELYGFDRFVEHQEFLAWLADQLVQIEADALVITGDVFDGVNPPVNAQRLLYRFLQRVTDALPRLEIVIVGGNHDSAARVELPAPLLDEERVLLVGGMRRVDGKLAPERVVKALRDKDGNRGLLCAAVPYLRPGDLPAVADGESAVQALYEQVYAAAGTVRNGLPLLMTGHLHVQGGEVSELSERRILVGGEEAVSPGIFPPDASYVALGHLHRPQTVGGKAHIRYAGAPFPMSVAEKDCRHGIVVVDFDSVDVREIRTVDIPRPIGFLRVPPAGSLALEEVERRLAELDVADPGEARRPFIEIAVKLEAPEPEMRARIDAALEGKPVRLTRVLRELAGSGGGLADTADAERGLEEMRPEDVFASCHAKQYGTPPSEELAAAFKQILAAVLHAGGEDGQGGEPCGS